MSKKMMKRSLVLGALMAFVITGNALAAEYSGKVLEVKNKTVNDINEVNNVDVSYKEAEAWVENNSTIIDNCTIDKNNQYIYTGKVFSKKSTVNNNVISITSSNIKAMVMGVFVSKSGSGNAEFHVESNRVAITDSKIDGYVYGALIDVSPSSSSDIIVANVSGNTVSINGTTEVTKNVHGAFIRNLSNDEDASITFSASNNIVNIESGTIKGDIYGSYVEAAYRDFSEIGIEGEGVPNNVVTVNSEGNTVNLKGGTIEGKVYAGYSEKKSTVFTGALQNPSSSENNTPEPASNNTISLQGDVDVSRAKLYGNNGGEGTGNKLDIDESYTGSSIDTLGAFDEIEIDNMQYGNPLQVANMEYKEAAQDENGNATGGTKITVNKMTMSGDQEFGAGTTLEIIKATNSNLDNNDGSEENKGAISSDSSVTIYKGTSEIIEVGFGGEDVGKNGIEVKEENITATTRNDQVLVIGESRAAAIAFVNQGSEIVETGLDALARDNSKAGDTKVFAAVYGNASEYATGSHVKVNGWSGIVGIGKTNANGLTVGAFFENGEGNYRTYNTVNNEFMRGDGEACYNGGGFLVRKDNANGVYTEASLRAGNLQNELRNAVRGSEGLAGYDVDTFYYGAHIGVGKMIPRGNEGDSIDVYGKFIYTHHDSEDFNIDGSDFHFDSVDSERLRLGFRINEVQTNKLSMYYGAAWEYEFNGDADNTTVGYDLATPSLGGSTMIGEIGMHYNASEKWSLDLNVRGYSGQRDGFTGSVQANYAF